MSCLEIHDTLDMYYDGRTPFLRGSPDAVQPVPQPLREKDRFGSGTMRPAIARKPVETPSGRR